MEDICKEFEKRGYVKVDKVPFRRERALDRGTEVTIYKGRLDGKPVAIKEILGFRLHDPEEAQEFVDAIVNESTLLELATDNCREYVVPIYNVFFDSNCGKVHIVMGLMKGDLDNLRCFGSREDLVECMHKKWKLLVAQWPRLIKGLRCLHDIGIIHRDIKRKNVFIDQDDNFRYGDFGISCMKEACEKEAFGTAAYIYPLMLQKENEDEPITEDDLLAQDYWALAMTYLEMLSDVHRKSYWIMQNDLYKKRNDIHKKDHKYFERAFFQESFIREFVDGKVDGMKHDKIKILGEDGYLEQLHELTGIDTYAIYINIGDEHFRESLHKVFYDMENILVLNTQKILSYVSKIYT